MVVRKVHVIDLCASLGMAAVLLLLYCPPGLGLLLALVANH